MPKLSHIGGGASLARHLSGGGVAGFIFSQTISSNTNNYNLKSAAIAAGWDQVLPLLATVTINSGIVVGSASTGSYAFDTGATFPAGTTLALNIVGAVRGRGGAASSSGGPALRAQYALSVNNTGSIDGGGGGGGTGGSATVHGFVYGGYPLTCNATSATGYGGTGGTGAGSQGGASGGAGGSTGSFISGSEACGPNGSAYGGTGGTGGSYGSTGSTGASGSTSGGSHPSPTISGGSGGGAGGAAVNGNSYVTWVATGTRNGGIS